MMDLPGESREDSPVIFGIETVTGVGAAAAAAGAAAVVVGVDAPSGGEPSPGVSESAHCVLCCSLPNPSS